MDSTTAIRNQLIDQLLVINDKDFLLALSKIIESAHVQGPVVSLTESQRLMLAMSEDDIAEGRIIDQHVLHERELLWLKRK